MRKNFWNSGTSFLSAMAGASSAGVSACAGGVCAVAAQTGGAALMGGAAAGTAGWIGGVRDGGSSALGDYPWWHPAGSALAPAHAGMPWWIPLVLLALWVSSVWTILRLAKTPVAAWLAAGGSIAVTVADLRWLHGGAMTMCLLLAFGILLLLTAPVLPVWDLRKCLRRIIRWSLLLLPPLALGLAFWLQFAEGWQPCPLCWLERAALLGVWIAAIRQKALWSAAFSILGFGACLAQTVEMGGPSVPGRFLAQACGALGPGCGEAGSRMIMGEPIALWAAVLFLFLVEAGVFLGQRTVRTAG